MLDIEFSKRMYENTEKANNLYPPNAVKEIALRYKFTLNYIENKNVLEIGPGTGYGSKNLIHLSKSYSAIEYSSINTKEFKKIYPKINIKNINFLDIETSKYNKVECIVSMANIYYFDFHKYIKKVNNILNKNGILIFCTTNKLHQNFIPAKYSTDYYSLEEIRKILDSHFYNVKFFGVFKKTRIKLFYQRVKKWIKLILSIFFKEHLINNIKVITKDLVPLPTNIDNVEINHEKIVSLNNDKDSKQYMIIYCVAEKK